MNVIERLLPGLAAYPNIHPMLVHFPVALFPVSLLFAAVAFLLRRMDLLPPARLILVLGTLGAAVSVATGLIAQESLPHGPGTIVSVHRTLMLLSAALAALLSICAIARRGHRSRADSGVLAAGLLVLNVLVLLGADRGALAGLKLRAGMDLALPQAGVPDTEPVDGPAAADTARGRALFETLECASCHGEPGREAPGIPPSLAIAGSRLRESWMRDYILRPHRIRWADHDVRPVLRMPDYGLDSAQAEDIASFLATRTDTARFPETPVTNPPLDETEARKGRELIGEYACKGCHVIGGTGNAHGPALDGAGDRLRPAYIYALLMDPKGVVPRTPMTDFDLWSEEARALTAYLTSLHGQSESGSGKLTDRRSHDPSPHHGGSR